MAGSNVWLCTLVLLACATACAARDGRADDHIAIRELASRYAYGADALAAQASVSEVVMMLRPFFTPKAKIRLFVPNFFDIKATGIDEYVALAKQAAYPPNVVEGQHLVGSHLVTFTGKNSANMTSHFLVSLVTNDTLVYRFTGNYYDTAVKKDGKWKLSSRQIISKNLLILKSEGAM